MLISNGLDVVLFCLSGKYFKSFHTTIITQEQQKAFKHQTQRKENYQDVYTFRIRI